MEIKEKTARISIFSNSVLVILKMVAGFLTGSVSIISETIHSLLDLFASFIAFFSVKVSHNLPDKRLPFCKGKFKNFSGVAMAILIFIAACWIVYEAIQLINSPTAVESISWGLLVMAISAATNLFISRYLYKIVHKADIISLEADAFHLKTDIYTSIGVFSCLVLIMIYGKSYFDPIVSILVAILILKETVELFKNAVTPLKNHSLPQAEIVQIEGIISLFTSSFNDLRTRKPGSFRFIDFHLEVNGELTVKEAHDFCNKIEDAIKAEFPSIDMLKTKMIKLFQYV